jgi:hypothetical protein
MNRGCASVLVLIGLAVGGVWLYNLSEQPEHGCSVSAAGTIPDVVAAAICNTSAAPVTTVNQGNVRVVYNLDPWALTAWSSRVTFYQHVQSIVPAVFARFPQITSIDIFGTGKFKDVRGNESRGNAAHMLFTRANASTIRWNNINPDNLPRLADSAWLAPGLEP